MMYQEKLKNFQKSLYISNIMVYNNSRIIVFNIFYMEVYENEKVNRISS